MPRKCPTGKRARIPAPAAGSPLIVSHADDTRYGLPMRRPVAAGNSVAPACSETRCEKRRLVRERGPEAIRQSRPGSAPAWLRTPGPERLVTRTVPSSAEPAGKSVAMTLTPPTSSGKTVVGVRHFAAVRPGSISGGSIRPEPAVARGRPERCLEKA